MFNQSTKKLTSHQPSAILNLFSSRLEENLIAFCLGGSYLVLLQLA